MDSVFGLQTTLIIGAAYTLWMYKRVIFGPVVNTQVETLSDLTFSEISAYVLLAFMVIAMGVYPKPWISYVHQNSQSYLVVSKSIEGLKNYA